MDNNCGKEREVFDIGTFENELEDEEDEEFAAHRVRNSNKLLRMWVGR